MARCLLGIGSNLGDRAEQMDQALARLGQDENIDVLSYSDWLETAPVGGPTKQQTYLNGAIVIETKLDSESLLRKLLQVERSLGRERTLRWGPRNVDLDLLLYGEEQVDLPGLTVPHAWMALRKFVLQPAATIAADMVHPVTGWTLGRLFENLSAQPFVIAVVGARTAEQIDVIDAVARDTGAEACQLSRAIAGRKSSGLTAEQVRATVFERSSAARVGSETPKTIESGDPSWSQSLRATTTEWVKLNANADKKTLPPMLFDFWWWEAINESTEQAAGKPFAPSPNLLIWLSTKGSGSANQIENVASLHEGPSLILPGDDLGRLEHDITAAIQGVQ